MTAISLQEGMKLFLNYYHYYFLDSFLHPVCHGGCKRPISLWDAGKKTITWNTCQLQTPFLRDPALNTKLFTLAPKLSQ